MLTKEISKLPAIRLSFIEPMYAQAGRDLPNGKLWAYEVKLDDYRYLAAKRDGRVMLWSRRANAFTTRFHEIADACTKLPSDTLIQRIAGLATTKCPFVNLTEKRRTMWALTADEKYPTAARRAQQPRFYRCSRQTPIDQSEVARGFQAVLRVLKIRQRPFYNTRHTFISMLDTRLQPKVDRRANRSEHGHDSRALRKVYPR